MAPEQRSERITVRVAPTERQMLDELAEADGLDLSDVIRLLTRKAYAERFGRQKPIPKP